MGKTNVPLLCPLIKSLRYDEVSACPAVAKFTRDLFGLPELEIDEEMLGFLGKPGNLKSMINSKKGARVIYAADLPRQIVFSCTNGPSVDFKTPPEDDGINCPIRCWAIYIPSGFKLNLPGYTSNCKILNLSIKEDTPRPSLKTLFSNPPDDGIFWTASGSIEEITESMGDRWCVAKAAVTFTLNRLVRQKGFKADIGIRSADVPVERMKMIKDPLEFGSPNLESLDIRAGVFLHKLWEIEMKKGPVVPSDYCVQLIPYIFPMTVLVFWPLFTACRLKYPGRDLAKKVFEDKLPFDHIIARAAVYYCQKNIRNIYDLSSAEAIYLKRYDLITPCQCRLWTEDIEALKETGDSDAFFSGFGKRFVNLTTLHAVHLKGFSDMFYLLVSLWLKHSTEVIDASDSYQKQFFSELLYTIASIQETDPTENLSCRINLPSVSWCKTPFIKSMVEENEAIEAAFLVANKESDTRLGLYCECVHCAKIRILSADRYAHTYNFLATCITGDHLWVSKWNGRLEVSTDEFWSGIWRVTVVRLPINAPDNSARIMRHTAKRTKLE